MRYQQLNHDLSTTYGLLQYTTDEACAEVNGSIVSQQLEATYLSCRDKDIASHLRRLRELLQSSSLAPRSRSR